MTIGFIAYTLEEQERARINYPFKMLWKAHVQGPDQDEIAKYVTGEKSIH